MSPFPPRRRWMLRLTQAIVTVALLVLLWQVADGGQALEALATAHLGWILATLAALTLHTLLAAERWRLTAASLGLPLGRGYAVREYYLAQLVNSTVPGGVVGDAGRAVRTRDHAGLTIAAQAVVVERFAGQVALLATMIIAVTATWLAPGGLEWPTWMLGLAATITVVALAVLGALLAARWLPGKVGPRVAELSRTARLALLGRRVVLPQLLLSAGTTACILFAFFSAAAAVGLALSFAAVVALVPLILLTMLVPLTISGWGLREGASAALLPLAGATASASLASSVVFGLVALVTVLPGLAVVWVGRRTG